MTALIEFAISTLSESIAEAAAFTTGFILLLILAISAYKFFHSVFGE